ncbi:MAG: hypothetical protein DYH03_02400 [Nitrospira sp. NTP1]|nr:hypothetical protein [Nitrospira sp. NTP1]
MKIALQAAEEVCAFQPRKGGRYCDFLQRLSFHRLDFRPGFESSLEFFSPATDNSSMEWST